MADALLIYADGKERHLTLPKSLSPIPDPVPVRILLSESGEVLSWVFRGQGFGLPVSPTDVIMVRDPHTPDECPVFRQWVLMKPETAEDLG